MSSELVDMVGVPIIVGSVVAYGKSSRYHPINIGIVKGVVGGVDYNEPTFLIQARGYTNLSRVPTFHMSRLLVLPSFYEEFI